MMLLRWLYIQFFFFKQKTVYELRIIDWGSDVCSSDLAGRRAVPPVGARLVRGKPPGCRAGWRGWRRCTTNAGPRRSPGSATCARYRPCRDRKSGVEGKGVSVRVDFGGRRLIKKKICI